MNARSLPPAARFSLSAARHHLLSKVVHLSGSVYLLVVQASAQELLLNAEGEVPDVEMMLLPVVKKWQPRPEELRLLNFEKEMASSAEELLLPAADVLTMIVLALGLNIERRE